MTILWILWSNFDWILQLIYFLLLAGDGNFISSTEIFRSRRSSSLKMSEVCFSADSTHSKTLSRVEGNPFVFRFFNEEIWFCFTLSVSIGFSTIGDNGERLGVNKARLLTNFFNLGARNLVCCPNTTVLITSLHSRSSCLSN